MFNTKVVEEAKQYTGLAPVKVLAINPTGEWLVENGFRNEVKEQDYTYEYDSGEGYRVVIFVEGIENKAIRGQLNFNLPKGNSTAKSGNKCFVDNTGASSYAESVDAAAYLDKDTAIHGSVALANLIKFVKTWTKQAKTELDITKISKGDFSELLPMVDIANKAAKEAKVNIGITVLLGVTDKGYSAVYTQSYIQLGHKKTTYMIKALQNSFSEFKANYQNSLLLQEYTLTEVASNNPDSDNELGGSEITTNNDLPF